MKNIQYIEVDGPPHNRGFQQGKQLTERIEKNIAFYKSLIKMPETELLSQVNNFIYKIKEFNHRYCEEIEAIAEGAGVDPVWIYFLNCRTEILNNEEVDECTTLFFKETSILAQNWDWAENSEELIVVMKSTDENNNTFIQLTEPGILGKIGMNDKGVGVCLNILSPEYGKVSGVPIHILLRAILESESVEDAKKIIKEHGSNTVSNVLIGSADGTSTNLEMNGLEVVEIFSDTTTLFHTNHYLNSGSKNELSSLNSKERYECINKLTEKLKLTL